MAFGIASRGIFEAAQAEDKRFHDRAVRGIEREKLALTQQQVRSQERAQRRDLALKAIDQKTTDILSAAVEPIVAQKFRRAGDLERVEALGREALASIRSLAETGEAAGFSGLIERAANNVNSQIQRVRSLPPEDVFNASVAAQAQAGRATPDEQAAAEAAKVRGRTAGSPPVSVNVIDTGSETATPFRALQQPDGTITTISGTPLPANFVVMDRPGIVSEDVAGLRFSSAGENKQLETLANLERSVDRMARIGASFSRDLLTIPGKVKLAIARAADSLDASTPAQRELITRARRFTQLVDTEFNAYRREITGAAAALAELESLKDAMLNKDLSPTDFESAFNTYLEELTRSQIILERLLNEGFTPGDEGFGDEFDRRFLGEEGREDVFRVDRMPTPEEARRMLQGQ